jgi:hypothetical protein
MGKLVLLVPLLVLVVGCASNPNQVASNSYDCKIAPLPAGRIDYSKDRKASSIEQADARAQLESMPYYRGVRMARMGAPYNLEDAAYGCR